VVEGIKTNIPLHRELMVDAKFMAGGTNIHYLEEWLSRTSAEPRVPACSNCGCCARRPRRGGQRRAGGARRAERLGRGRRRADAAEQALFGEPGMPPPKEGWQRSLVIALFPRRRWREAAATLLAPQDFFAGCKCSACAVPEQDWVRLTQSQFEPVEITPDFWIVPTWHEPPAQAKAGDPARPRPGLRHRHASHHPHVPALDRDAIRRKGQRVLDYGCGSGILAIGAAKFGAATVDAVDIDEAAVQSTEAQRPGQRRAAESRPARRRPAASTTPCWPTSWPRRSRCWRRCCAAM
jgi:hypothetical protein